MSFWKSLFPDPKPKPREGQWCGTSDLNPPPYTSQVDLHQAIQSRLIRPDGLAQDTQTHPSDTKENIFKGKEDYDLGMKAEQDGNMYLMKFHLLQALEDGYGPAGTMLYLKETNKEWRTEYLSKALTLGDPDAYYQMVLNKLESFKLLDVKSYLKIIKEQHGKKIGSDIFDKVKKCVIHGLHYNTNETDCNYHEQALRLLVECDPDEETLMSAITEFLDVISDKIYGVSNCSNYKLGSDHSRNKFLTYVTFFITYFEAYPTVMTAYASKSKKNNSDKFYNLVTGCIKYFQASTVPTVSTSAPLITPTVVNDFHCDYILMFYLCKKLFRLIANHSAEYNPLIFEMFLNIRYNVDTVYPMAYYSYDKQVKSSITISMSYLKGLNGLVPLTKTDMSELDSLFGKVIGGPNVGEPKIFALDNLKLEIRYVGEKVLAGSNVKAIEQVQSVSKGILEDNKLFMLCYKRLGELQEIKK
jgi:hypothetical protein